MITVWFVVLLIVILVIIIMAILLVLLRQENNKEKEKYTNDPYQRDPRYIDVVVARYQEDVQWLRDILSMSSVSRVYLYNKGLADIPQDILQHAKMHYYELVNKGRESDTYLNHIIRCYDYNLGDKIVFTQGDPFDQAPEFMEFMRLHEQWDPVYQPISSIWMLEYDVPPLEFFHTHGTPFGNATVLEIDFYMDSLANIGFDDVGLAGIINAYLTDPGCMERRSVQKGIIQDVVEKYKIPIKTKGTNVGTFHYGCIFAVPKASIIKHEVDLYKRLLEFTDACANAGYILEHMWSMIFRADPNATLETNTTTTTATPMIAAMPPATATSFPY